MKQVKRTQEENARFLENLDSAKEKIKEALGCITYNNFPEINKNLKDFLKIIAVELNDILIDAENDSIDIFKPV